MFNFICRVFIKNYEDVENEKVREKYGIVFSIFCIICNILLVVFKLLISFITNSVSIRADGFNNLSDVGSNLATLFGFKLSNKHADIDHPYGHGRMEYVSGMIVSFLILLMGFTAAKDALNKIIHPEDIESSSIAILILIASILVKLVMAYINNKASKKINSGAFLAAAKDSLNDSFMTGATLLCLIFYSLTNINIDPYIGFVVSLLVIKSGISIFSDVLDTILGKAPDKELLKEIEKTITSHPEVLDIHDLMLHDYGPSHKFMSLHVEVDASKPIMFTHDIIDNIEQEILAKYKILTTIHMDPIDKDDELTNKYKQKVKDLITSINKDYKIHDFRIVAGPTHKNLVFDVLLPANDENDIENLRKEIVEKMKKIDKTCNCVINFDRDYV